MKNQELREEAKAAIVCAFFRLTEDYAWQKTSEIKQSFWSQFFDMIMSKNADHEYIQSEIETELEEFDLEFIDVNNGCMCPVNFQYLIGHLLKNFMALHLGKVRQDFSTAHVHAVCIYYPLAPRGYSVGKVWIDTVYREGKTAEEYKQAFVKQYPANLFATEEDLKAALESIGLLSQIYTPEEWDAECSEWGDEWGNVSHNHFGDDATSFTLS